MKISRLLLLLLISLSALTACQLGKTPPPTAPLEQETAGLATPTRSSPPSETALPPTPRLQGSPTVTRTPLVTPTGPASPTPEGLPLSSAQACLPPEELPPLTYADLTDQGQPIEAIQGYLNAGGRTNKLQNNLSGLRSSAEETIAPLPVLAQVAVQDLTGDEIEDVILALTLPVGEGEAYVIVYTCQSGGYAPYLLASAAQVEELYNNGGARLLSMRDANQDGMAEVLFSLPRPPYQDIYLAGWDGRAFTSRLSGLERIEVVDGRASLQDTDGDKLYELIVEHGFAPPDPAQPYRTPQRKWLETWEWDGSAYRPACRRALTPPEYRFEAVYDGDDAIRCGDYTGALAFYQQALEDESLLGWSAGQVWPATAYAGTPTPAPDPLERERLEAYALYRSLLAHLLLGEPDQAESIYDRLLDEHALDSAGGAYRGLATALWEAYSVGEDLSAACAQAIAYASLNPDQVLAPLGFGTYGQRELYPEDICTLTNE